MKQLIVKISEFFKKRKQKRLDSYETVDYPRGENTSFKHNVECKPQGCRLFDSSDVSKK